MRELTLFLQGRRDEQSVDLTAMAQLADMLDDDTRRAQVAVRRANRLQRMADWTGQGAAAREGMA